MALIYLQHTDHGQKIAYNEKEAVHDEAHGWERYDPDVPTPKKRAKKDELPAFLKPRE